MWAHVAVQTRIFKELVVCGQRKCPSGSVVRFAVMADLVKGKSAVNQELLKLRSTKFCYFFITGKINKTVCPPVSHHSQQCTNSASSFKI